MSLTAFAVNCSLKSSTEASSTDKLVGEVLVDLASHGVTTTGIVRITDHNIRPGVTSDEGDGDQWPAIRRPILDADVFVLARSSGWATPPAQKCQGTAWTVEPRTGGSG